MLFKKLMIPPIVAVPRAGHRHCRLRLHPGPTGAGRGPAGCVKSAAANFGDEDDLAVWIEWREVGVLKDFAVDRHRHALLDLAAEAGEAAVELQNHAAEIVRLHLELGRAAGEPAGGLAR